jgi:outer membrane lipoprotein-sorting protein
MKKVVLLVMVVFVTTLVLSSCTQKECPAYSKADTEQAAKNV